MLHPYLLDPVIIPAYLLPPADSAFAYQINYFFFLYFDISFLASKEITVTWIPSDSLLEPFGVLHSKTHSSQRPESYLAAKLYPPILLLLPLVLSSIPCFG